MPVNSDAIEVPIPLRQETTAPMICAKQISTPFYRLYFLYDVNNVLNDPSFFHPDKEVSYAPWFRHCHLAKCGMQ